MTFTSVTEKNPFLYLVFVHDRKDNMWIGFYYQPISMTVFQVDVSQDTGLYDMEGKIFEKVTTSLNKKASPCKNYVTDETDFNSCCKKVFTEFIANNSNCTAPGIFQKNF